MIFFILLEFLKVFSPATSFAEEDLKIATSISPVLGSVEGSIEIPQQIPYLIWDSKGIQVVRQDIKDQKYFVKMKGAVKNHLVESFSYQVEQAEAKKITIKNGKFDILIPIEKSPTQIRLWLEVSEGKAVKIYSDLVKVHSNLVPGAGSEKKIDY